MIAPGIGKTGQRGAALLIVLLLVATLSFIALAITERTALASARSVNERARAQSLWRAFGAQTLAGAAIEAALLANPVKMSIDDPWMAEPLVAPMKDGAARLFFADATRCFNVNSLAAGSASATGPSPVDEFVRLAEFLGLSTNDGVRIAEVIIDWIDADSARQPQGAEDDYYTGLGDPYRTGGGLIADISELRAMRAITRGLYAGLKPYLCAHPDNAPSKININMLRARDAPILAAMVGNDLTIADAEELITARPFGGYNDVSEFLAQPALSRLRAGSFDKNRIVLTSQYVRARAEIAYDTAFLELTTIYEVSGNEAHALRRRLGASE